ncbi:MAG: hypothetical protein K2X39_04185 [Silvanigrellaceae bacterium]|nr:hypothetical protein [Silvanigrellaceae bacterium]
MSKPQHLEEICGWILPDGTWLAVEQWWHISAIYDLQEAGYPALQEGDIEKALKKGDEIEIRALLAHQGFIKISRHQVDALNISNKQLQTLQGLLELCNPEDDLEFIQNESYSYKYIKISRIMKLKCVKMLNQRFGNTKN